VSKWEGPLATLALATNQGGTNWAGGSYDPETHIAYIPSQRSLGQLGLVPGDPNRGGDFAYIQGQARNPNAPPAGAAGGGGGEGGGPGVTVVGLAQQNEHNVGIISIEL